MWRTTRMKHRRRTLVVLNGQKPRLVEHGTSASKTFDLDRPALVSSINEAGKVLGTWFITYVIIALYLSVVIWQTTDLDLLLGQSLKLPVADISVPLQAFFLFAPLLLTTLHIGILAQLGLLGDKLGILNNSLAEAKDIEWTQTIISLSAFPLNHLVIRRGNDGLRFWFSFVTWLSFVILPLGSLIGAQIRFLAYHSEFATNFHRFLIVLDVMALVYLWPRIFGRTTRTFRQWARSMSPISAKMGYLIFCRLIRLRSTNLRASVRLFRKDRTQGQHRLMFIGFASVLTSIYIATIPGDTFERQLIKMLPEHLLVAKGVRLRGGETFIVTCWLFENEKCGDNLVDRKALIVNRNIVLSHQRIIGHTLGSTSDGFSQTLADEILKLPTVDITDRDLRFADFSFSVIPRLLADETTHLEGANLDYATIYDADLHHANMRGVSAIGSSLVAANLSVASADGASFEGANLTGANLAGASFVGANLTDAKMAGAILTSANFRAACLYRTEMQATALQYATFVGAVLVKADLSGTIDVGALNPNREPLDPDFGRPPDGFDFANLDRIVTGHISANVADTIANANLFADTPSLASLSPSLPRARQAMSRILAMVGIDTSIRKTTPPYECVGPAELCAKNKYDSRFAVKAGRAAYTAGISFQRKENDIKWPMRGIILWTLGVYLSDPNGEQDTDTTRDEIRKSLQRSFIVQSCQGEMMRLSNFSTWSVPSLIISSARVSPMHETVTEDPNEVSQYYGRVDVFLRQLLDACNKKRPESAS
ncbi:Secreted effector protein pipB2 [Caballeronia choica]|uniref:Secreted effector protein pipB2 n=1 Tax=Caballeronia choica TaxID=326476 RepID=A0A158FCP1_9BURK|nr:pentapeptide repeat-containing protein [Caballeronia choica]SAL17495.1 Secreted effector protein pipB2 [Caballeronia choica]